MTGTWVGWLLATVSVLCVAVALTAQTKTRACLRAGTAMADRMELLWQQTRGIERLDEAQREQLGASLYRQFDRGGLPWDDLDDPSRGLWRHQADRVAAEVASLFAARAHREP